MATSDSDLIWMTYNEAATALRIKPDSVKRRAASRKWARRPGNDGFARVGVPRDLIPPAPTPAGIPDIPPAHTPDVGGDALEALRNERNQARLEVAVLGVRLEAAEARAADLIRERDRALADAADARADARTQRDLVAVALARPAPVPRSILDRLLARIRRPISVSGV